MTRRALMLAGALLVLALLAPGGAQAHALLVDTAPQRGATLREAPSRVVLRFSESVEANFGALRVFDAAARRVDDGRAVHPGGDATRLAAGLRPGLPDGTYVATYRVISADSHPVSGGLAFSVGRPGAGAAPTVSALIGDSESGAVTQAVFGLARGLTYLATALVLGGLLFLLAVWRPALHATRDAAPQWGEAAPAFAARARVLLLAAATLGAASGIAGIVMQGATAGATSGWAALEPAVVRDVLGTRFGEVWGLRVLAFGAIATLVAARRPLLALAPAAGLAVAPALAGHASTQSPAALLIGLDVAHVLAMSAWIGGLAALLVALPAATRRLAPGDRTRLLAAALLRFSPLALGCVAVLLVTGTVQAIEHVGAWDALLHTGFGRAVLAKAGLIATLIAIGVLHRGRVLPRLRGLAAARASPGATGHLLRRVLSAEVALVLVVLGVTAALVSLVPPSSLAAGPFAGATAIGPLRLEATVDPARVGSNELHLYLLDGEDGSPSTATKQLTVTLALPRREIGPLSVRARAAGPGHYVIAPVQLVPAGDWRLRVTSRVSQFDQYEGSLTVPVR